MCKQLSSRNSIWIHCGIKTQCICSVLFIFFALTKLLIFWRHDFIHFKTSHFYPLFHSHTLKDPVLQQDMSICFSTNFCNGKSAVWWFLLNKGRGSNILYIISWIKDLYLCFFSRNFSMQKWFLGISRCKVLICKSGGTETRRGCSPSWLWERKMKQITIITPKNVPSLFYSFTKFEI